MLFSYNWLQEYIKNKLPRPEKLAELLTMHSFEVEGIKKVGDDFVLNVDILPNRAHDCLCHIGLMREIGAILKKKTINYKTLQKEKLIAKKGSLKPVKIEIQSPLLVPRYSALVIEGIEIKESPKWLKARLEAIGIRSINNIVDLTNFLMLETGQPFHAFDYDKIREQRIILRESKKGEKVVTLDNIERKLNKGMLVAEDKDRLIDLIGIMGGKLSEISLKTKNIVLQAANFDRKRIYLTSRELGHSTDASNIYTQGIDPNLTIPSLERASFLFKKLAGGKIIQIIDIYPKKILPKKIKLGLNHVEDLLGKNISKKEMVDILKSLEFKIVGSTVEVPTFRLDISLPEDLIEEIGRISGLEDIKADFPLVSLSPSKKSFDFFWEDITKNALKEVGFSESYNYSFFGEKEAEIFGYQSKDLIEIINPVSIEQKYLRNTLIPNLLRNVRKNQKLQLIGNSKEIRIFELGKIFLKEKFSEKRMLAGVIAGKQDKVSSEKFYELKGIVDSLLTKLGITNVWYDDFQPSPEQSKTNIWNLKRCAEVKVNNQEVGFLGEINQNLYNQLGISENVLVFDLDFKKILNLVSEEREYKAISLYPAAIRDLAVLVPSDIKVVDVLNIINVVGKDLIVDVDLFDIYEGTEIPGGKKNFAFHIVYQARDRTLTAQEIDGIQNKIIKTLEKNIGWQVRR